MKALFATVTFLMASAAMACPQFAGNYTCDIAGRTSDVVVTQTKVPGGASYHIKYDDGGFSHEEDIIADGKRRNVVIDADFFKTSTQIAHCYGKTVKVQVDGKGHDGTVLKTVTDIRSENNQLLLDTKGEVRKGPVKDTFQESSVCTVK